MVEANFLSCLCGSEPSACPSSFRSCFLSCLCGSEHRDHRGNHRHHFLSCLCGSELGFLGLSR